MEAELATVPGFFAQRRDDGSGYWTLSGAAGLPIPVRDTQGRIVALSVRRDEANDGNRYQWVSSKRKGGVGPGSPIHVPQFSGDKTEVRVTEGALKANIATQLSGILTIGLPGVSSWKRAAQLLKEIGAKTVRVAYDADACHNRHVAESLRHLFHHLLARGFDVRLESWDEENGKGIDDLLAAKKIPDILMGNVAVAAVESIREQARAADPAPTGGGPGRGKAQGDRPQITVCMDEHITNDEAVAALARDTSLYQRAGQLVRVIRDESPAARGIRRPYGSRIESLPEATLRERLTAVGWWVKEVLREGKPPKKVPVHPPKWAISAVHNRGDWPNVRHLALAGDRLVLFDNLDGKFGNAILGAALTTTSWKDRLLGVNRVVEAPLYMTWYATGNNVAVGADTSRRICPIRLETDMERPEERKGFRFPSLLEHVNASRGRLLGAALTILRAYCVAGRPDQGLSAWGSFEGWSALVRGAVVWVGMPDPAEARVQLQEQSDTTAESMAALLECGERMDPEQVGFTTAEVVAKLYQARDRKDLPEPPDWHAEMRAAIDGLVDRGDARRLGNRLRLYRRRIFSGRYIDHAGSEHRAIRWAAYPASTFRPGWPSSPRGGESDESGESVATNARTRACAPDDSEDF
jgi:hypothetical protein